ncbi:hypothetical protein KI387_012080, partial [Taxus chinensis]
MTNFLHTHLKLILFSVITTLIFAPVLAIENADAIIALPSSQNAKKPAACSEKYKDSVSCPVSCFRADPVCGVNGITYWCGCAEAHCAGVEVAKIGFCEVGNGGSGLLSGQAFLLVLAVPYVYWDQLK